MTPHAELCPKEGHSPFDDEWLRPGRSRNRAFQRKVRAGRPRVHRARPALTRDMACGRLRAGCGSPSESPNRKVWFVTLRNDASTQDQRRAPALCAGLSEIEPGPEPLRVHREGDKPADYGGRREAMAAAVRQGASNPRLPAPTNDARLSRSAIRSGRWWRAAERRGRRRSRFRPQRTRFNSLLESALVTHGPPPNGLVEGCACIDPLAAQNIGIGSRIDVERLTIGVGTRAQSGAGSPLVHLIDGRCTSCRQATQERGDNRSPSHFRVPHAGKMPHAVAKTVHRSGSTRHLASATA